MSCRAWRDEIALMVGDEMPPDEAAPVQRHLESCPACRALAAELRADRGILADLAAEAPPVDALERMRRRAVAAVEPSRAAGPTGPGRRGRGIWLGLAAALLAAAVALGLWTSQVRRQPAVGPAESPRIADRKAPAEGPSEPPTTSEHPVPTRPPADPTGETNPPTQPAGEPDPTPKPSPEEPEPPRRPDRLARGDAGPTPEQTTPSEPSEPITIRIVSDDPDIVFYWLTDEPKEVPDEATV